MNAAHAHQMLKKIFTIDLRTLSLFRISLGFFILVDLAFRSRSITEHYGAQSIVGLRTVNRSLADIGSWSLYGLFEGNIVWVILLFFITGLAAAALLVGYKTRYALVALLILIISLHHANHVILQGGDTLLRVLLIIALFLPLNHHWSVERISNPEHLDAAAIYTPWTVVALIQGGLFYFFAVQHKTGPEWYDGTALYYVLSHYEHARYLGTQLVEHFPSALMPLTYIVLGLQWCSLCILFSPYKTVFIRGMAIIAFTLMHICMGLMLHIGWFSLISIVQILLFVPTQWWETALGIRICACFESCSRWVRTFFEIKPRDYAPTAKATYLSTALAVCFFIHVLISQSLESPLLAQHSPKQLTKYVSNFGEALGIHQRWALFTEDTRERFWIAVVAKYSDGRNLDLLRGGVSYDPELQSKNYYPYTHFRDQKFFSSIRRSRYSYLYKKTGSYLCAKARQYALKDGRAVGVSLTYHFENTPVPGTTEITNKRSVVLLSGICLTK
ncbi:MAG: hypothetical protein RI911_146 [Candidatus Parcubacteria bacterium]